MTYQELEQTVLDLQQQISDLTDLVNSVSDVANLSYDMQNALQQRGFLRATSTIDDISPALGTNTLYVATISGGTLDHPITFKDGILITP